MHRSNSHQESEPLYIITLRHDQAEQLFKKWIEHNKISRYQILGRKMYLYSSYDLDRFRMTWNYDEAVWQQLLVWDNWIRRHIDI
jgi:hypothetical protein